MESRSFEDLVEILRDDWRKLDSALALRQLVDSAKLSKTSTKRVKELMASYSDAELAGVLNMKTNRCNKTSYRNYKLRQTEEDSKLSKEISCLHSEKKSLLEQRSILINEILLYYECTSYGAYSQ